MNIKKWMILMLAAGLALLLSGCAGNTLNDADKQPETQKDAAGLLIPLDVLSDKAELFDWDSDGIAMQVIALKGTDGGVQMAYNTCQVCAGSPYAYFEISGNMLTCQNCGNTFSTSAVGKAAGGCNPMPVNDFELTDEGALISAELLSKIAPVFKNWKAY